MQLQQHLVIDVSCGLTAADFIAERCDLPKVRIKDAMNKGAVWLKRGKRPQVRLRRAKAELFAGDELFVYYDDEVLRRIPGEPRVIEDLNAYSVWFKPAGVLSQGTEWGDHCSMLRIAEQAADSTREVFLVHRLDREASGLMIIAHNRRAAADLSKLFEERKVEKTYRVEVLGQVGDVGSKRTINEALDGKEAITHITVEKFNAYTNASTLLVTIDTGRKHQIRKHLAAIGHPVMGDPLYGEGNRNRDGMQLKCIELAFRCPLTSYPRRFSLNDSIEEIADD